jgi:flavin-dependent dehydrogenase
MTVEQHRGGRSMTRRPSGGVTHADAVVVGAGPAGSAAATFLAQAGHDVVLLEKERFPRVKVCGDGLTPRAVKALRALGLDDEAEGGVEGWDRQQGLRMYGGGVVLDLPWPELDSWPSHSLTATRELFDETLARNAVKAGAQLWEETEVTGPVYLSGAPRGGRTRRGRSAHRSCSRPTAGRHASPCSSASTATAAAPWGWPCGPTIARRARSSG